MAGKMWERQIVETKSLFFLQMRSKRVEEVEEGDSDVVSIKQQKKSFEAGLPSIIAYCQGSSQFLVQFLVVDFFKIHFILSFSLKNMPRSKSPSCLLSNPLQFNPFQIRNIAYRSGLWTSIKYISCSRSRRNTYLLDLPAILFQKDQTKRCTHDKNRKREELSVKLII